MYTTEPENEHLKDKNIQSPITSKILNSSNASKQEETKEIVFSNTEETKPQMEKSACPPQGTLNKYITNGVLHVTIWCAVWSVSGPRVFFDGSLFGLLITFYGSIMGGKLLELIRIPSVPHLPPLLGMLLAGFTIRNVPSLSKFVNISNKWSSTLRNSALTLILVKAGLGLDPQIDDPCAAFVSIIWEVWLFYGELLAFQALKRLRKVCLRLSMGPCLLEACAAAVISHFLMNFPWQWGFLLGFVVGAVSPAVVVPAMLRLQEDGYGVEKGIPTLLIAASSLDDIVAITGFGTCMSIVFSTDNFNIQSAGNCVPFGNGGGIGSYTNSESQGDILNNIANSFWNIIIGVLVGIILGIFVCCFPSEDQTNLPLKRAALILSMCITAVLGSIQLGIHGAGGLCTLILTVIGGMKWSNGKIRVQKIITTAWDVFQPLLFGLVGLEVSVASLKSNAIGVCVATMSLALLVRISCTFVLMSFAGFNVKEKIFVALSWMPKATVQAVLGPLALETARTSAPYLEAYSKDVMTIAFLAILITAPNGALIIDILGPKLLKRHVIQTK